MAIKTIKFRDTGDGLTSIADGADGIRLATASDGGEYPVTVSGITCGWTPDNNGSISAIGTLGVAPLDGVNAIVPAGGGIRLLRVDRAAGTFVVRLQTSMPDPSYASSALRILQSDGTTVAFAQTVGSRIADGSGNRKLITDGTLVVTGASDPGQSITTSGAHFLIEWSGAGSFAARLGYIEFDDGAGGGVSANQLQYLRDQARMAGIHTY